MKFCQEHWDQLRKRIDDRGLTHLIAKSGAVAVDQMKSQIIERDVNRGNFDPLMSAHWAIAGNVNEFLARCGMNPLYLLSGGEEEKCDGRFGPQHVGRPWPRCPLCYINMAHELTCTDSACELPKKTGYDWMLDRAADDSLEKARELKLVGAPS